MREGWRNPHNKELHNLRLHQILLIYHIKNLNMGETCGMKGELGNANKNLVVNPEQMKPNGAFEWENIINMDAKE